MALPDCCLLLSPCEWYLISPLSHSNKGTFTVPASAMPSAGVGQCRAVAGCRLPLGKKSVYFPCLFLSLVLLAYISTAHFHLSGSTHPSPDTALGSFSTQPSRQLWPVIRLALKPRCLPSLSMKALDLPPNVLDIPGLRYTTFCSSLSIKNMVS